MVQKFDHVTDAELAVLQVLWERGGSTIRQLTDILYPQGGASHYATVQKLLQRLETKKYVSKVQGAREQGARAHMFQSLVNRDEMVGRQLQVVADKLFEGSLTPLLSHLVNATQLTPGERRALRRLVEGLEKESRERGESS